MDHGVIIFCQVQPTSETVCLFRLFDHLNICLHSLPTHFSMSMLSCCVNWPATSVLAGNLNGQTKSWSACWLLSKGNILMALDSEGLGCHLHTRDVFVKGMIPFQVSSFHWVQAKRWWWLPSTADPVLLGPKPCPHSSKKSFH